MGKLTRINLSALILGLCTMAWANCAFSFSKPTYDNPYVNRVVEAIKHAEGLKSRHPYGVLSVKTGNPRQTCYEVVNWRYAMWLSSDRKEPFLRYLQRSYAPQNVSNDPFHLNDNWYKNVRYFMGEL